MKQRTQQKFWISLGVFFLCAITFLFGQGAIPAFAQESTQNLSDIDYTAQTYTDIPTGFNVATEDVIYKLSCKNPRSQVDTGNEDIEEYLTTISFKASMGCQIYFVDGYACNSEDADYDDSPTTMYQDYYEILHYDEVNQFVYIRFKNLDTIEINENADIEDMNIRVQNTTYNSSPQYIYLSNIEKPITTITSEDVYFSTEVKAGTGSFSPTGYNIYSLEYMLKVNQKVSHLVDSISVSFLTGGSEFTLYESTFSVDDGEGENGYLNFECITLGANDTVTTQVQLQATITYGDKSITVISGKSDLITLWKALVANNFSGYDYETYMTEANKTTIRQYVAAYDNGFYMAIKGSKHSFAPFDKNTDIKTTSLIFRAPIENFNYMNLHWGTNYWQGYTYHAYVKVDSSFNLTTTVYKMVTNEDGTVTVGLDDEISTASTITYDDSVAQSLLAKSEIFVHDGYVYVRVTDDSMVEQYFPQRATSYFNATAQTTSYTEALEANTATIIYDEYNKGLLEEIDKLTAQIEEMQAQLSLSESQREQLNALQSTLDGLRMDYNAAQGEIAYLNQQMEVMREEYQKKIDQLIGENGDKEPIVDTNDNTATTTEEQDFGAVQVIGIIMGVCLIAAVVIMLIPSKGRKSV